MSHKSRGASFAIQRILSKPPSARYVSPRQLQRITDQLFPSRVEHKIVSAGWEHALEVAILSRYCRASSENAGASAPTQSELRVIEHMLNYGRFPVTAWHVPTRLLQRWRDLRQQAVPTTDNDIPMFPPFRSLDAAKEMMLQLSFAKQGVALRREPWLETLHLYDATVQSLTNPTLSFSSPVTTAMTVTGADEGASEAISTASVHDPAAAVTLKRMRHILLTTLLNANRWQDAVRVFMHALYQRDMPGHITTGYLVQQLGQRGAWRDVLRIYDLSVRLIAARAGAMGAAARNEGREWGTAFSLAMEAVSHHCPSAVPDMVRRLVDAPATVTTPTMTTVAASSSSASLTQLDGHFLSAVQRLPSAQARQDLVRFARNSDLLDSYKLIRGLVSHGRWMEALALYCEATRPSASGGHTLSRKALGKSRLHLLHASSVENVERVVTVLQVARQQANTGVRGHTHTHSLSLNDAEVECVLSKALQVQARGATSFWRFGLAVLRANYPEFLAGDRTCANSGVGTVRTPSVNAISLFVHDHNLPWETALTLAERVDEHHCRSHHRHSAMTHSHHRAPSATATPSVPPLVLLWNAVADLLYHQGQGHKGFALFVSVMQREGTSPSAEFLLQCPAPHVRSILASVPALDGRVLYHILQQTSPHTTRTPDAMHEATVVPVHADDGETLWVPKSFFVLSAWMEVRTGCGFLTAPSTAHVPDLSTSPPSQPWLDLVPASVHCEVLKKLQSPTILIALHPDARRCELTVRYLRQTLLTASVSEAPNPPTTETEQRLVKRYAIAFEGVLALVSAYTPDHTDRAARVPPTTPPSVKEMPRLVTRAECVAYACDVLSAATTRVRFLPPTHLLLPRQLSRLLPRFHVVTARDDAACAVRVALASHLLRCCHTQLREAHRTPTTPSIHQHAQGCQHTHRDSTTVSRLRQYHEPAFYHALLKLCCRVSEYESSKAEWDLAPAALPHRASLDVHELVTIGCDLIKWQEAHCGLSSVGEASLTLLFHLCATTAGSPQGTAPSWQRALTLTTHLASRRCIRADGGARAAQDRPHFGRSTDKWLSARHWHTYQSLFGWERGLAVWYHLLPDTVLNDLSSNAEAVNYCLGLGDRDDPMR